MSGSVVSSRRRRTSRPPDRIVDLNALSDRELLGRRLCDLGLRLPGSPLEARVGVLYAELEARGIAFRPHVWLSTEWFAPDGVPGFAIPFYLAHPRLLALEAGYMHEVEGGTERWFRQLLRHETGHALDSAYRLHEWPQWHEVFGPFDAPYYRRYQPRPYSKRFVHNLKEWYAQSHPAEDFAETVAVWLDPHGSWRTRYRGWPAMRKLRYVDRVMHEIAGAPPLVRRKDQVESISTLTLTLAEYYEEKRKRYRMNLRRVYERDLKRLFAARKNGVGSRGAADYLRSARPIIRELVADKTGARLHAIDRVLQDLINCSAELDLVVRRNGNSNGKRESAASVNARQLRRVAAKLSRYLAEGHDRLTR